MEWLKRLLGGTAAGTRRVTVRNPLVIQSPRIAFLNLLGESAAPLITEDKAAFQGLFTLLPDSQGQPPACDVLLIYAQVSADGKISGSADGLREIIKKSGAPIVIVASENEGKSYIAAAKRTGYGNANLVLTLRRKGSSFPTFFSKLFRKMFEGKSMPVAWVQLAPQVPGLLHEDSPETIFAAEISHIVFE